MSDTEDTRNEGNETGLNQKELSPEEKKRIADAKNERRLAKLQEKGPEAVAAAELRKQRLREREEAKKERVREKKAKLAAEKALENGGATKAAGKRKKAGSSTASEDSGPKKAKRSGPTAFELSVAAHAARLPWGGTQQPGMSTYEDTSSSKPKEEMKASDYVAPCAKPAASAPAPATSTEGGAPAVKLSRRQLAAARLAEQNANANSYESYGQQNSSTGGSSSKSYGSSNSSSGMYGPGSSGGGDPYAPNGGGGGGG
jgi:membrane protein involved in colicin uptake